MSQNTDGDSVHTGASAPASCCPVIRLFLCCWLCQKKFARNTHAWKKPIYELFVLDYSAWLSSLVGGAVPSSQLCQRNTHRGGSEGEEMNKESLAAQ
jgi:hypothetical protein